MRRIYIAKNGMLTAIAFALILVSAVGAEIPEVFVQTGHTQGVKTLAVSGNQRYLVTAEDSRLLKLWDVESGREIRTVKFDGITNNVYFANDSTFILVLTVSQNLKDHSAEIYNINGEKTATISLPPLANAPSMRMTKTRRYLYTDAGHISNDVHFYDIKDGSEIKLPELTGDLYCSKLINLGHGFFGIFWSLTSSGDIKNIRNTGYVIYDEELKVRKKGILKGMVGYIGEKVKVDPELRFVYQNRDFSENPTFTKHSLDSGDTLFSMKSKKTSNFTMTPDGKIVISKQRLEEAKVLTEPSTLYLNLSIVELLDGGLYKEKEMVLESLSNFDASVVGRNGLVIAGQRDGAVRKYNYTTGRETGVFGVTPILFNFSSCANGKLLNIMPDFSSNGRWSKLTFNLWNLKSASLEKFNVSNSTNAIYQKIDKASGWPIWTLSEPDAFWSKVPKEFFQDNLKKEYLEYYEKAYPTPNVFLKNPYSGDLQFGEKGTHIIAYNKTSKSEVARLYAFADGEWIIITSEGYFNASPNGAKYLNVRVGTRVYSIDNFYEKYYNPGLVASVLQGGTVSVAADIRKGVLPPPEVRITAPPDGKRYAADTVTVTVTARDMGGGIDEIRLSHNGKVVGEDARGIQIVPKGNAASKKFFVTMVDGQNTFRATGFSKDRTESNPSEVAVFLSAPQKDISLYLFASGINTYQNPALSLNYAEPDARAIVGFFRTKRSDLFSHVYITEFYNDQVTKAGIAGKLVQLQNTNPQDVVLIYLAGHGENVDDKWYFIPYELTYPERPEEVRAGGLSSDELAGLIKKIKAQKVLVLIDACKAGGALVAFRGFEDRKALSQLSRSTGVHIVAASTNSQFAAEVKELGHGVFTYTLLEGLGGKAAGPGEAVTVRKLVSYIEEHLPEITKKYKQEAQYPVVNSQGMDFPLAMPK